MRSRSLSSSLSRFAFTGGVDGADTPVAASRIAAAHRLLIELLPDECDLCIATKPGGFTRGGVLSPSLLVLLLLFMAADAGQHGYQSLLESFWDEAQRAGVELPCLRVPAAASFCNARRKLRPEALRATLRTLAKGLLARNAPRWHGLRVFAIDASRFCVQRSPALWERCGAAHGAATPQVQVTTLFELFAEFPLDVDVGPYRSSERSQAATHLDCLSPGDLVVLDRGYPSFGFLRDLLRRGLHFAVRVPSSSTFPAVMRFVASSRNDAEIEVAPSSDFVQDHPGEAAEPLRLRVVRLRAPDRASTVILTTLARGQVTRRDIEFLYRRRWRIEEHYKLVKSDHFGQRQFHAKTFAGVAQEIYAQALLVIVTRSLAAAAAGLPSDAARRPTTRVHIKAAVSAVGKHLVELMLHDDTDRLVDLVARLREQIRRRLQPLRPRRSCVRRSYKPSSKWHANGRRGSRVR